MTIKLYTVDGEFLKLEAAAPFGFTGMIEYEDGGKWWRLDGKVHREDGPAIMCINGEKHWYIYGKLHREDGPAWEWTNGSKQWFIKGKRHRIGGPAVELVDRDKEWWVDGKVVTKQAHDLLFDIMRLKGLL